MPSYRLLIFYVVAVLFLSAAYYVSPISREALWQLFPGTGAMAEENPLATALIFFIASTVLAFLAFPAMPMVYVAAGFYINGFAGGAIVIVGSAIGGSSAFLFYRKHIRFSAPLHQKSAKRIWLTLIGLRLSPLVPAPLVNFFAAVFHVSPPHYVTASLLGSAPLVLFYWQIGQQGHQFLFGETVHWWHFSGYLVILTLSTLLSAMGPWKSILNELKQLKDSAKLRTISLQPASKS